VSHLTGPAEQPIIHDIALRVDAGETVVVLGPIQSGKSMLLRHILGLERAREGRVTIGSDSFDAAAAPDESLKALRARVGVVFETSALLRHLSALENVELPLLEHTDSGARDARNAAQELLVEVELRGDADSMPVRLGRDDQRRVALARALALRPCVLLLDEPTAGLDAHAAHEFDRTVDTLQARHGFGVLIFSHEVRHAFGRAKEVDIMAAGRIVARGDRDTLLQSAHPIVSRMMNRRSRA
jgi:phospholipid/cholesterol/gamma-HCH transport system ATP-binding protein